MKILHIVELDSTIGGIATVLAEQLEFEKDVLKIQSEIYNTKSKVLPVKNECYIHKDDFYFEELIKEKKYDFVIFHSLYIFKYIKLSRILYKNKINYYIKPHGGFSKIVQKANFFKKKIANFIYFNKFIREASGIIYLKEDEKNASYFYKLNKNIFYQSNGIKINEKIELNKSKKIILFYLGRYDLKYKGLKELFNCFIDNQHMLEKIPIDIEIYGCGNLKSEKKIKNYQKKLRSTNIKVKGKILGEAKEAVLKKASIMILPSKSEGMPMGVLEALSYGVPCILTKETNMLNELIIEKCGWECNHSNIYEIILKAIKEYDKDRLGYIDRAQNLANRYNWKEEYILNEYRFLYTKLKEGRKNVKKIKKRL
ncbi:glycosyltransferase [Cetobacterium somerae]